jgi:hypothetical protein
MAFKDQGVWYFPCAAPAFPLRIGFHALSYGPPPPYCGPGMFPPECGGAHPVRGGATGRLRSGGRR